MFGTDHTNFSLKSKNEKVLKYQKVEAYVGIKEVKLDENNNDDTNNSPSPIKSEQSIHEIGMTNRNK